MYTYTSGSKTDTHHNRFWTVNPLMFCVQFQDVQAVEKTLKLAKHCWLLTSSGTCGALPVQSVAVCWLGSTWAGQENLSCSCTVSVLKYRKGIRNNVTEFWLFCNFLFGAKKLNTEMCIIKKIMYVQYLSMCCRYRILVEVIRTHSYIMRQL